MNSRSGSVIVTDIWLEIVFESFSRWLWGERLHHHDQLFGDLSTKRIMGRGRPTGNPPVYEWYGDVSIEIADIESFCVHADRNGPTEIQRRAWSSILTNKDFELRLQSHLQSNYLRHESINPEYVKSLQIEIASKTDWYVTVTTDAEVQIYIPTSWDPEHNLRLFVRDGIVEDWTED